MRTDQPFDLLMRKALDGEAMGENELCAFARQIIESPEHAREFALLRRIEMDAPEAARMRAPQGLADRVMDAIAEEPIPSPAPRMRGVGAATVAMAGALAAAGTAFILWGGPARIGAMLPSAESLETMWAEWQGVLSALATEALEPETWTPWIWTALVVPAMAVAMHVGMWRRDVATGKRG